MLENHENVGNRLKRQRFLEMSKHETLEIYTVDAAGRLKHLIDRQVKVGASRVCVEINCGQPIVPAHKRWKPPTKKWTRGP